MDPTIALRAMAAGLCVVPPREDGTKAPEAYWKEFQRRLPTTTEIGAWYGSGRSGIGLVCGAVSGGLELLEWEGRAVEAGIFDGFMDAANATGLGDLLDRIAAGYLERSPSGGIHLLYRCPESKTMKLARQADHGVLIETKGEGGYTIVAPSNGKVHPNGGAWKLVKGGFETIITITPEERSAVHALARTFDESPVVEWRPVVATIPAAGVRPGDDFNRQGDWRSEVLEPAGWTLVGIQGAQELWRRPGKEGLGWSAVLHTDTSIFVPFSTSTPFPEMEKGYRMFSAYAYLLHDGDFKATARDLVARGYGEQTQRQRDPEVRLRESGAPNGGPSEDGSIRAADVTRETVQWLWSGRLPLGKVAILDGDPGLGKSTLTLDIAARVSTGRAMPDGAPTGEPRNCLVISAEDGAGDTIRPRLEAASADLNRIRLYDRVREYDEENGESYRPIELPKDLPRIDRIIRDYEIVFVIFDPLVAFLGATIDSHRDQDVRRVLYPLAQMADATGAAILCLRHLNKAPGTNPLYRGGASIGIIGAARAGLLVARHPEDPGRRVLAVTKSNLAAEAESLVFRLEADPMRGVACIAWQEGASALRACDLLRMPERERQAPKSDSARDLLGEILDGGPVLRSEIERRAADHGISWRTIERAKTALGVLSKQVPVTGQQGAGPSWWLLPGDDDSDRMNGPPSPSTQEDGGPFMPNPTEDKNAGQGGCDASSNGPPPVPREWSATGVGVTNHQRFANLDDDLW